MSAHHPDDFTLLDYSAGSLDVAQALAVSVHLSYCRQCQEQLKSLNALGGIILAGSQPGGLTASEPEPETERDTWASDEAFDALMDKLNAEAQSPAPGASHSPSASYHNPLERYLPRPLEELDWHQQTGSIARYDLNPLVDNPGHRVALQKIKAGAKVPQHSHRGQELTVVLTGGFSDELGVYQQGDYIARDPSHHHSPTAMQNEDCICLTVLDAPMRFTGPLMRWLNPLIRF